MAGLGFKLRFVDFRAGALECHLYTYFIPGIMQGAEALIHSAAPKALTDTIIISWGYECNDIDRENGTKGKNV